MNIYYLIILRRVFPSYICVCAQPCGTYNEGYLRPLGAADIYQIELTKVGFYTQRHTSWQKLFGSSNHLPHYIH